MTRVKQPARVSHPDHGPPFSLDTGCPCHHASRLVLVSRPLSVLRGGWKERPCPAGLCKQQLHRRVGEMSADVSIGSWLLRRQGRGAERLRVSARSQPSPSGSDSTGSRFAKAPRGVLSTAAWGRPRGGLLVTAVGRGPGGPGLHAPLQPPAPLPNCIRSYYQRPEPTNKIVSPRNLGSGPRKSSVRFLMS